MVCEVIRSHPALEELPVSQDKPAWCLFMAFEHERIHIVTPLPGPGRPSAVTSSTAPALTEALYPNTAAAS